jgi:signal transduction histidine kinase
MPQRGAGPTRPGSRESPQLISALPVGGDLCAMVLDRSGVVQNASESCRSFFDAPAELLVGRAAASLLEPFDLCGLRGVEGSFDAYALRGARPAHVRVYWSHSGEHLALVLLDLERACRGPFSESAALSRMAARLTHEVRNPLASIKMVIQTMARALGHDERTVRRLAIAAREVRTVERILAALSELARGRAAAPSRIALATLVPEAVQICEPELAERGVTIAFDLDPQLPDVAGDPERLRLGLSHLFAAVGHAMGGTGALTVRAQVDGDGVLLRPEVPEGAAQPNPATLSIALVDSIAGECGGELRMEGPEEGAYGCNLWLRRAR